MFRPKGIDYLKHSTKFTLPLCSKHVNVRSSLDRILKEVAPPIIKAEMAAIEAVLIYWGSQFFPERLANPF